MRNDMVEICPFMAMSFHFFWRWHVDKESFPDMNNNRNWFKLKVIHGARPQSVKIENKKRKNRESVSGKLYDMIEIIFILRLTGSYRCWCFCRW
jgi:hypothetical protein